MTGEAPEGELFAMGGKDEKNSRKKQLQRNKLFI